jgi:hypothetical protein
MGQLAPRYASGEVSRELVAQVMVEAAFAPRAGKAGCHLSFHSRYFAVAKTPFNR